MIIDALITAGIGTVLGVVVVEPLILWRRALRSNVGSTGRWRPSLRDVLFTLAICAVVVTLVGCGSPPGAGGRYYSLINIRLQLAGSSTDVYVDERLTGAGNSIKKDFPFEASVSAPTSVSLPKP